jgi:cytochrome P450/nitrite reductase/ring-hydroxylating ferredoxin subunit
MKPETFVRVAAAGELVGDGPFALSAEGRDLALVRTPAGWRAFEGRCPHQGALLGEGEIEDGALVCRNHRWRFALDSGHRIGGPECLVSCPAVEREGAILVDVSSLGQPRTAVLKAALRSLDDLPGPRPSPIVGNALQIDATRAHLVMEGWIRQFGPIYRLQMMRGNIFVTSAPDMIDEILRARPETFRRSSRADEVLSEAGIRGVFNAEGAPWRSQRRLAVSALAQRHLRDLFPHIRTVTRRLKRRWLAAAASGAPVDVVDEMKRFTVDVTMLVAFGHDSNTLEKSGDVIQEHLECVLPTISRRILSPVPIWRYVRLPRDRRFDRALVGVREWLEGLLRATRDRLATDPQRRAAPSNFIEAMIVASDENGEPFSDETVMSNLVTMLIAGEDTTAFTLAWAFHELCDQPRWRMELQRQADAVLGETDAPADVEEANRLTIAAAVANETLRLRPAAPVIGATANVDTTVGDFLVPKDTTLLLLPRPAALDSAYFVDPDAFRPERWLPSATGAHDMSAYVPFGSGPRMCPGRSLALIEMKTALATLCRSFDFERVGDAKDVSERFGFTMSPAGLRMRLKLRSARAAA